jgi:Asp/Glu/hydantoin racemase
MSERGDGRPTRIIDEGVIVADAPGSATGGRTIYGARVGILMLETGFPRIPGDLGNAGTWPFPVLFKVVRGASPDRVVRGRATGLEEAFFDAASELVHDGADGLTTSCGFLSLLQARLAAHVEVPVASSSLMQVPMVQQLLPPGRRCGVVTISAESLSVEHLRAAGAPQDTPVEGLPATSSMARTLLNDELTLDVGQAQAEVVAAGRALIERCPQVSAIVLECTNMGPYAAAVQRELGVPVYDIVSFITWFHAGLAPRHYA